MNEYSEHKLMNVSFPLFSSLSLSKANSSVCGHSLNLSGKEGIYHMKVVRKS